MSAAKDHHLLPAFYLRGFCNKELHEEEGHDKEPSRCRVWIHDLTTNGLRERGVKNVAVERHFYSAQAPGGALDPKPEGKLSVLEGRAAKVIRSLHYGRGLSGPERADLARFVALAKFRTPGFRSWLEGFSDRLAKELNKRRFPTVKSLEDYLRDRGSPLVERREVIRKMHKDIREDAYALRLSKNYALRQMFDLTDGVAEELFALDWTFVWAHDSASFVTSDDPFVLLDAEGEAAGSYARSGIGVASPGSTKMLPLSQDVCLLIGDGSGEGGPASSRHVRQDRKKVRDLNLKQARYRDRWLIARDRALLERLLPTRPSI